MQKQERYKGIIEYFIKNQPNPETELKYKNVYELLVSVILSAQCTDKRVNIITPELFKKFPDIDSLSKASVEEVYNIIKSCTYPNNKSKNLISMAKILKEDYNSHVPSDIKELQKLPGVGRKTANVIASVYFNKDVMPVDTHVFRVAKRIGLTTDAKTPLETELQLTENFPKNLLNSAHHWLLLHGRYVCKARNPNCIECEIKKFCKFYEENKKINYSD
ncbi:MAG: endonuclease III [Bacteroidales bacterium]|nr:endonuclease III [Bacteroidales bacterium]